MVFCCLQTSWTRKSPADGLGIT